MLSSNLSGVNPLFLKGGFTTCDNNWSYDNIWVGYNRFYFIMEGECVIEINGIHHVAKPGNLFFLPAGSHQTLYVEGEKTMKKYWLHCSLPCGEQDFSELLNLPHFMTVTDTDYVESLFKSILARAKISSLAEQLEQKASLLKLISYYIGNADSSRIAADYDPKITYIISYIEQNLSRQITLSELSDLLHYHPNYFVRYFKGATGYTPMAFIHNRRISRAQKLLLNEKLSIHEISLQTGFQDSPYFSRCFKKKTGFKPLEYRNISLHKHTANP